MDDRLDPTDEMASEKEQRRLTRYLLDQNRILQARILSLETSGVAPVGWVVVGKKILDTNGDTITIDGLPPRNDLLVRWHVNRTGGTINTRCRFNGDTGANYAQQTSTAFGAAVNAVNLTSLAPSAAANAAKKFGQLEIGNTLNERKLVHGFEVDDNGAGAASSCNFAEIFGKWDSSAQIYSFSLFNVGTGDYIAGSQVCIYAPPNSI